MGNAIGKNRNFLFLQGPHGPFFAQLAQMLRQAGAEVWRVGFNAGDAAFWPERSSYIPFTEPLEMWPSSCAALLAEKNITDLVLYGDTRPAHAEAIALAKAAGVAVHVFEEGYLRPYWATYERDGTNGNSRLMSLSVAEMKAQLAQVDTAAPLPPAHWGDTRQHVFYGALYHWFVLFRNGRYRHFTAHRDLPVLREFQLYLRRLLRMPRHALGRARATRRIRQGGFPYHLCLLQLDHDSAFQAHSPFARLSEFLEVVVRGFAEGAPGHHHLVFKAHPLDTGQTDVRQQLKTMERRHGLEGRIHFVRGGKLAPLLDEARTAVTVNSTAGQQVLWRGIPLKTFGSAVYGKPEFVSAQSLPEFFACPTRPDTRAYRAFRRYLLETSQLPGGFYAARGRRALLRHVVDLMLIAEDPYDALTAGTAAPRQQLRVVG